MKLPKIHILPQGRDWIRFGIMWGVILTGFAGVLYFMVAMPGWTHRGPLAPLTPDQSKVRDNLARHVQVLAGDIGVRYFFKYDSLLRTVDHITRESETLGYPVARQQFFVYRKPVWNLEVEVPGTTRPKEIVLIGAHYDTIGETPGADDNASGVAVLLELERLLKGKRFERTVRFVFFANEEPPFYSTDQMGSRVYARRCRARGEDMKAILVLECVGYYSDLPGSQLYPFVLNLFYPDRGDFICFVGDLNSRGLVRRSAGSFRRHEKFPCEGIAALPWIPGIAWSDHASFWNQDYAAAMVTDTATFRYRHYHEAEDTPDQLDYDRMARVATGMAAVVEELATSEK